MVVIGLAARKTEGMERGFEDIIYSLEQVKATQAWPRQLLSIQTLNYA